MLSVNSDGKVLVRRCFLTLRPFRIFVLGIGFFTLCFLMTSLGGQFSAKRLADSPFTIRTEVLGLGESRGALRRMNDILETLVRRMDILARLENASESRRAEDNGHFTLDSLQPGSLMEKIQAIAQNVSDIAVKVDQILRNSLLRGKVLEGQRDLCDIPRDPRYPDCSGKVEWMRSRWTSDPCYAFYGVDGTECSFLMYLSEVEWFCPVLPWRNQSLGSFSKPHPKKQAAFRTELSSLLDLMGTGKESLIFMKKRLRRLEAQWLLAARRLEAKIQSTPNEQKQILVHIGFLTEESGDVFSPRVLKGGPLGEMVQWADILAALYVLGHSLKITVSVKELQRSLSFLGVPPGRGNCPLTEPLNFDLIYTDYHGMQQMKQHMGLSFRKYRCRLRVVDTFGTEPAYNHEEYATLHGYRTNWGYWNLHPKQFMTMFPHTPDNSFMGFVTDELNETERQQVTLNKVRNMAVVYGKEAAMWKGKEKFLSVLHNYMEVHGTVYFETQRPPEVPAFVKNHGLLPQQDLQQLLKKSKLFIGFGFPYEGPAPLEAVANGCVFLQPRFSPPHSSLNHEFFRGKPTSREVSSQHPYMEMTIGRPHVVTVDFNNTQEFEAAIKTIMRSKVDPYLPYEFTSEGMLQRLHAYIQHQEFCSPPLPFPIPLNTSQLPLPSSLVLINHTYLVWPSNEPAPPTWPPVSAMQVWLSAEGESCTSACWKHDLVCEPTYFSLINQRQFLEQLGAQCDSTEAVMSHLYPAVSPQVRECYLQRERLLFSCSGQNTKFRRLCPCRDYQRGQVALCKDCS
ncbi:alpha-1,6-mannosylglycoprotein 6-beta-N-acetylglucosaminyltransferase B isoform X2 [Rana temporaria]|uniref:alpha-1,6-mannosylglycoprotein 6-beta-N-acetylglucosaminyltransferase B isoform X2 n=1 Tax=Rana temporaria TaxID=8407 RepID=UPI001AAE169B|nr:alpha-1,6-mannosylglycoprotein 6-beta-N-acetylglucosaminyltransferase B isoform X2 [Rana temporaria]